MVSVRSNSAAEAAEDVARSEDVITHTQGVIT